MAVLVNSSDSYTLLGTLPFAEAHMALGYGPEGPPLEVPWVREEKAWVMDWCWSRVEDVAEDARARASEWETNDDS